MNPSDGCMRPRMTAMSYGLRDFHWMLVLAVGLGAPSPLNGQEIKPPEVVAPSSADVPLTLGTVDEKIKEVDALQNVDENTKAQLKDLYTQAKTSVQAATDWNIKAQKDVDAIKTADARLRAAKQERETPPNVYDLAAAETKPLE